MTFLHVFRCKMQQYIDFCVICKIRKFTLTEQFGYFFYNYILICRFERTINYAFLLSLETHINTGKCLRAEGKFYTKGVILQIYVWTYVKIIN